MKRLIICSILTPVIAGLGVYAVIRVGFALLGVSRYEEWELLGGTLVVCTGMILPFFLVAGLIALPIERRLVEAFKLRDLWPQGSGYERSVRLTCSVPHFFGQLRALIAETTQVIHVADDGADLCHFQSTARLHVYQEYRICALVDHSTETATIRIRPRVGGWFVPVELGSAGLLAGIVGWMADQGFIQRDFGPLSRPERFEGDLGKWLPSRGPNGWVQLRAPLDSLRGREVCILSGQVLSPGVVITCLAAIASSLTLGPLGFGASRTVYALPMVMFFVYFQAHLIRAVRNVRARRPSGEGEGSRGG